MAPDPVPGNATRRLLAAVERLLDALTRPGPLLVACSGGGDSTALLWALAAALRTRGDPRTTLHATTVNHGLRAGSAQEAEITGAWARSIGIPHTTLNWQHDRPQTALQAAARAARYSLLAGEARRIGAVAILVGHNADDQTETIAMRRARGEGEGLSGMAPAVLVDGFVWLLRPLLGLGRAEIRQALSEQGVSWLEDPSNDNPRFERVRIRQSGDAGDTEKPSTSSIRSASSARQAAWLTEFATVTGDAVAAISPDAMTMLDDPDTMPALFKLAAAIGGKPHLPPREAQLRARDFLKSGGLGRRTLGGTVFDRRASGLYLYRESRNLAKTHVPPQASAVWDGRYVVQNKGSQPLTVSPAGADPGAVDALVETGIPHAIARRAAPAMPLILPRQLQDVFRLTRQIAAHSAFLPSFELPIAECFASLFDLAPIPPMPVRMAFA